jgi:hypothetical protein
MMPNYRARFSFLLASLAVAGTLGLCAPAHAQPIPRDEYLRFVPLEIPRVIRSTPTSERLHLYGDPADPEYRDVDPVDGMDDRRFAVFEDLSVRFAPFMMQNTWGIPMDFKKFRADDVAGLLNVDTWNLMTRPKSLTSTEEVPFFPIAPVPCTGPVDISVDLSMADIARLRNADCRVQQLMEEYDPFLPATARLRTESIEIFEDWFQVLWYDVPGRGPKEWREIFENPVNETLREKWRGLLVLLPDERRGQQPLRRLGAHQHRGFAQGSGDPELDRGRGSGSHRRRVEQRDGRSGARHQAGGLLLPFQSDEARLLQPQRLSAEG